MQGRAAASGRSTWFASAVQAYRCARFVEARGFLDEAERSAPLPAQALLLRARVLLKREPGAALADLEMHRAALDDAEIRLEAELLAGAAYARLGDYASAEARFHSVARAAPPPRIATELAYQHAQALWIERRLDEADAALDRAESHASGPLAIECRVLRGAIAAARGDVRGQAVILLDALGLVRRPDVSVLHHAVVTSQIAYLARELPSAELRANARAELPRVAWTDDISDFHYTALRAVAWCHALEGDDFNAFRRLKEAAAVAPSAAWKVMASCDRSYLATMLGEQRWAEHELRDAHELAARVEWTALDGEERFALALLAELFAPRDGALALSYVAKYRATGTRYARTLSSSNDRRVGAMEAYSFGVVQRALGAKDEAARLLGEAWTVYDEIGYDWRAGRTALALAEVCAEPAWRDRAREKLRDYRRSWLGTADVPQPRVAPVDARSVASRLTPAQRAVFDHLLDGTAIKAIARDLGRTENTVRNHVKAIFKAFDVNSRVELMARAPRPFD
jgi:DNA-binding CsgD family transcriptional regulator/tetratricopeptide (TPR) repeat protein